MKCSLGDGQQGHEEGSSRSLMEGWFNLPSLLSSFSEMGYNEGGVGLMDFPYSGVLTSCRNLSTGLRMDWLSSEWCELVSRLSWRQAGHKADPPSRLSHGSSAPRWVTSQWQDRTTPRAFPPTAAPLALPALEGGLHPGPLALPSKCFAFCPEKFPKEKKDKVVVTC